MPLVSASYTLHYSPGLTSHPLTGKMSRMTETFSSKLAGISLRNPEGDFLRLGSLWEKGPVVLVFLRHYG